MRSTHASFSRLHLLFIATAVVLSMGVPRAEAATGVLLGLTDSDALGILDLSTYTVTHTISVGDGPRGIAVWSGKAYVCNESAGTVSVVDLSTYTVEATITVGTQPVHAVVSGTGVYVINYGSDNISLIDTTDNTVEKTIAVGSSPWEGAASGTGVFISNTFSDTVSVIDTAGNVVEKTISGLDGPYGMVVSGTGVFTLTSTGLQYDITVKRIDNAAINGAHFNRGLVGQEGSVVHTIVFNGLHATGTWTNLTTQDREDIVNGRIYVEVDGSYYNDGKIRGQIELQ